jgi:aryl-alcohol dehydrogenase-like predicted oxidoreductase
MRYNFLGNSGLSVSAVSFGNWITGHNADEEETQFQCFDKAVRSGVNFLDTAEVYGDGVAESVLGNIIKRGDYDRDTIIVSTKFMKCGNGPNGRNLSRKHLIQGMRNSLKRL